MARMNSGLFSSGRPSDDFWIKFEQLWNVLDDFEMTIITLRWLHMMTLEWLWRIWDDYIWWLWNDFGDFEMILAWLVWLWNNIGMN